MYSADFISRERVAMRRSYSIFLFAAVVVFLVGCGGGAGSTQSPVGPSVTGLAVTPATANVALGLTQKFSAKVTYSDGTTADVTSSATWSSSATAVATISAGLATTKSQGTITITAQVGSVSGSASLVVGPAALASIGLTGPATVQLGRTAQFKAAGS